MNNEFPEEVSQFLKGTPDIIFEIQWSPLEWTDWFYIGAFLLYSLLISLILFRLSKRCCRKELTLEPENKIVYNTDVCPICLSQLERPVRISCGHAYCAGCIMRYFEYIMKKGKCECPMCKATISEANLLNSGTTIHIGDANEILQLKIKKLLEKAKYVYITKSVYLVNLIVIYLLCCLLLLYIIFTSNILPL